MFLHDTLKIKHIEIEGIVIRRKWKEIFDKEKAFNAAMKQAVHDYLEQHPEEKALIESFGKSK